MDSVAVLQCYEKALELTRRMLGAAQRSDWDALVTLEKERTKVIDQLRHVDLDPGGDGQSLSRKRELIRGILTCDEQIQMLTQDWMRELREVLGSIRSEQRLSQTYES
ncbi:MAG TPA: flagellar protein FliT [Burkholderiales bacterium]|nr:flagellar protein FliT [Burkholderiales bacterium]